MTPILTTLAPGLFEAGAKLIDRLIPDPAQREQAKLALFQAAENLSKLLNAVPESLWWLFGAGYLGYTGARSLDKWRGVPR